MKGCIDCKFYESSLDYVTDGLNPSIRINRKCHLGNSATMNDWWNSNGYKTRYEDYFTELSCHEDTEDVKLLQDINGKLNELLQMLNKK